LGQERGAMTKLVTECNLIDVVANRHLATDFNTYQRGRRVIDYCLLDQDLSGMVAACGTISFGFQEIGHAVVEPSTGWTDRQF
jgi:hypothetical protein